MHFWFKGVVGGLSEKFGPLHEIVPPTQAPRQFLHFGGKDPPAKSLASIVGQNNVSQLSKPSCGTAGNERIPFEPQTAQSQLTKGKRSE